MDLKSMFTQHFGTGKLPALESITKVKAEAYPSMIPYLFNDDPMTSELSQDATMGKLRNPQPMNDGEAFQMQSLNQGFAVNYQPIRVGMGYSISKQMVDDGKFQFIQRANDSFAEGMAEVFEQYGADVFNDGFTVANGGDGKSLFASDHPIESGLGEVGNNLAAAPAELSITTFRELRNLLQATIDEAGRKVSYMPSILVTPLDLQDVAQELVKSVLAPDSANNAINTIYNTVQLLPGGFWRYLTSDTAYFLVCDKNKHDLKVRERQGIDIQSEWVQNPRVWEMTGDRRFVFGYSGWRGLTGNAGA